MAERRTIDPSRVTPKPSARSRFSREATISRSSPDRTATAPRASLDRPATGHDLRGAPDATKNDPERPRSRKRGGPTPDPRARELKTATGPIGRELAESRRDLANATARTATTVRSILSNRSQVRPRKSQSSGCALERLQSALVVPSWRSGGTLGAIYKKVAVRSIEKCLFLVRSMAGPPERICTSSLPTPMAAHRIGWRAVGGYRPRSPWRR